MTLLTFTYKKDDGSVKERVLIPLYQPGNKYFGVDITELDIQDQGSFAGEYAKLEDEFYAKLRKLMEEYDIKHNFRTFLASNAFNVKEEE